MWWVSVGGVVKEGVSKGSESSHAVFECGRECWGIGVVSVMRCVGEFIDKSGLIYGMIEGVDVVDGKLESVEGGSVELQLMDVDW